MGKHLNSLQFLSQSIAQSHDAVTIYSAVRDAIEEQLGENLGLAIARYNADSKEIRFPYLWVDGKRQGVEPYLLQEDAISKVIRRKRHLFLVPVENEKERLVNACFSIRSAISLIGVPLLMGGDVLGALVVMNYEDEDYFQDDDLLFLKVLASQLAIREYAESELEDNRIQIESDRLLFEATDKIRNSVDMQTIIETTAQELGRILGAQRVHIDINVSALLMPSDDEQVVLDAGMASQSSGREA